MHFLDQHLRAYHPRRVENQTSDLPGSLVIRPDDKVNPGLVGFAVVNRSSVALPMSAGVNHKLMVGVDQKACQAKWWLSWVVNVQSHPESRTPEGNRDFLGFVFVQAFDVSLSYKCYSIYQDSGLRSTA